MFEAYKIAVSVTLVNHASQALGLLTRDFAKSHAEARKLQEQLAKISAMGVGGAMLQGVGKSILGSFKTPLDEAKKFETEVARFGSLGFGDKVNRDAQKFAEGMKVIGSSALTNMTMLSDAMAVFKDLHHAEFAAPIMAKMRFANEAVFGMSGGEHSTKFMDMLKVIEFRGGLSSQQEFETQANFVQKAITGSRNRVDATQLLSALKTGGVALTGRSNQAFYLGAEPLIQEFGGLRYGTGAMSIYQNLVQARGSMTAQQELYRLGLLDRSKVEFNSEGRLKKARAGAFVGSSILEKEGELALLEKVLLPAFNKAGITSEADQIRELGLILSNRTGSSLMSRILQQRKQLHIMTDANAHAENIDQLAARGQNTTQGRELVLRAEYATLMKNLGTTILPIVNKALSGLIVVLTAASKFAKEHPTMTKFLMVSAGVVGVLATLGGTILLVRAGFMGLQLLMGGGFLNVVKMLASPFRWLGGAIMFLGRAAMGFLFTNPIGWAILAVSAVVLIWKNWDTIWPKLKQLFSWVAEGLGSFFSGLAEKWATLRSHLPTWMGGTTAGAAPPLTASGPVRTAQQAAAAGGPGNVYMDGRKVGEVVTEHQSREAGRAAVGTYRPDPHVSQPKPVGGHAR